MKLRPIFLFAALALWTSSAFAGSVRIQDSTATLSTSEATRLTSAARDWPFEAQVLIGAYPSREALEESAHLAIATPRTVALAVDPVHHHVAARFGDRSGVKPGDYDSVIRAGNASFRAGRWEEGLEAMGIRAQASAQTSAGIAASPEPVIVQHGPGFGFWFLFLVVLGFGILGWISYRILRRAQRAVDEAREEISELRSLNIRDAAWEDRLAESSRTRVGAPPPAAAPRSYNAPRPAYGQTTGAAPAYGVANPVIVQQQGGGSGDLLTGMLIGEELGGRGRDREVIVERDREVVRDAPRGYDAGGGSETYDGGSSDFEPASAPDTSSDSGGGSSDFDGGSTDFDTSSPDSGGGGDF